MATPIVHLRDVQKRPRIFTVWEKRRNSNEVHWAMECFAETLGVFFYVYFGIGSQVGWIFGNIVKIQGFSSLLQIGLAYACGIIFAITVCAGTSGGHFNPCVTLTFCVFKGFPKAKAARYIVAQILGAYLASLVVYNQWKALIDVAEGALEQAGALAAVQFTPNGPAGAFGNYLLPGQTLPRVFMNEFFNCTLLTIIIWACLDPTNLLVPPSMGTFVIALAYAGAIWGFAVPGISLNAARDVGARLAAMTIWGVKARGGPYSAISALVNIPATMLGAVIYEWFIVDSDRVVDAAHLEFINHHANHRRFRHGHNAEKQNSSVDLPDTNSQEKPSITTYEHAPRNGQQV
jgi:glycerol uptake facilitator-like aquaporin